MSVLLNKIKFQQAVPSRAETSVLWKMRLFGRWSNQSMCVKPDLSTKIKQSPMVMNPIYLEGLNPQKLYLTVTVANSNPALNPLSPNVSSANFF